MLEKDLDQKFQNQAQMLANRVKKKFHHLRKRFARQNIDVFRLYDWDIPEIRAVIDRNYQRSRDILTEQIDKLHTMAEALIKFETIDAEQIDDIMSGRTPRPPADWDESEPRSGMMYSHTTGSSVWPRT